MKKKAIYVLALFLGMGVLGQFTWIRRWYVNVECDGSSVNSARVYRNWAGDVLVDLRISGGRVYVVRDRDVCIPSMSDNMDFGAFILTTNRRLKIVGLGTPKIGLIKPKLLQDSHSLSFTNENGNRIQISM